MCWWPAGSCRLEVAFDYKRALRLQSTLLSALPRIYPAHRHCATPTQNPTRRDPGCGRNALLDDGASALIVFLPGTSSLSASLWALVPALPACSSADDLAQLPRLGFCVAALPNGQPPPLLATVGLAHTVVALRQIIQGAYPASRLFRGFSGAPRACPSTTAMSGGYRPYRCWLLRSCAPCAVLMELNLAPCEMFSKNKFSKRQTFSTKWLADSLTKA